MNLVRSFRGGQFAGRRTKLIAATALAVAMIVVPEVAMAQASPFTGAITGANQFRQTLSNFALAVGGIGMVACLMLGFFGKLNWKWVATGVGVSFALAVIPSAINWLATLSGSSAGASVGGG